jgi:hypothetical protein
VSAATTPVRAAAARNSRNVTGRRCENAEWGMRNAELNNTRRTIPHSFDTDARLPPRSLPYAAALVRPSGAGPAAGATLGRRTRSAHRTGAPSDLARNRVSGPRCTGGCGRSVGAGRRLAPAAGRSSPGRVRERPGGGAGQGGADHRRTRAGASRGS